MPECTFRAKAFEPTPPYTLASPSLPAFLGLTSKIQAVPNMDNPRGTIVSWRSQPAAVRYNVYVSPNPMLRQDTQRFVSVPKSQTQMEFETPIIVPSDMTFYFWVSYINPFNKEVFLQSEPVHTMIDTAFDKSAIDPDIARDIATDKDAKYYFEEMRRRNMFMLQNDGESFYLYIRRRYGQPCVCRTKQTGEQGRTTPMSTGFLDQLEAAYEPKTPSETELVEVKDPEYGGNYRCTICYGTGITGGYFPKIMILMRYGEIPLRVLNPQQQGFETRHDVNSWMLWHPKIKQGDLLVRMRTNERFSITKPGQSEQRGMGLHQAFMAVSLPDTDIALQISDDGILTALQAANVYDLAKFDWSIFS